MNRVVSNVKASLSHVAVIVAGCVMAGLGLAFVGVVALFALAAVVLAVLVAPFVATVSSEVADRA